MTAPIRTLLPATLLLAACLLTACSESNLPGPVNLVEVETSVGLALTNLSHIETDGDLHWRWFLGPKAEVAFVLDKERRVEFDTLGYSQIAGQVTQVMANGELLGTITTPVVGPYPITFHIQGKKGKNVLAFVFGDWNHGKTTFAPNDPRPMGLAFYRFLITPR